LTRRRLFWIFGPLLVLALLAVAGFRTRPVEFFNAYTESRMLLSGAETHTAAVAGHRVHYYAMGPASGPPVVLVHGLGGRSEDWRNLAPYLVRAGYRVYLPDLVGYGQSEQPSGFSYSVDDEAGVVVGLFDVLGLKQVDLGGWSMGGWIVQRVAAEQPDRVRKLMLFDSAGLLVKPDWDTGLFTPRNASELAELDALLMPHPPVVPDFVESQRLGDPPGTRDHADWTRRDRQPAGPAENAGADRVGAGRSHHSPQRRGNHAQADSAVAARLDSRLRPSGTQHVRTADRAWSGRLSALKAKAPHALPPFMSLSLRFVTKCRSPIESFVCHR
jgi:pimeloyl-ACP methyl ester carboxylesterase